MLQAGFASIDITPPLGTLKIGWLKRIVSVEILAPLFARVAVFRSSETQVAFVQLDTLFIDASDVKEIRQRIHSIYGFPGENIMVAATHNHAGPALAQAGDVPKDLRYAADLVTKVVSIFGIALERLQDIQFGFAHTYEWDIAYNRRVVMRDGTVRTHGTFNDSEALYIEGPVDPEVAVIATRDLDQNLLGSIVNFACHPTHYGGNGAIHPGYPGVMATVLQDAGCPYTLFLNGASGNLHTSNPAEGGKGKTAEETGLKLAEDVQRMLKGMDYTSSLCVRASLCNLDLPYRQVTEEEIRGNVHGAQRFIDPAIYDRNIPQLLTKIKNLLMHTVEIQVIRLGHIFLVGIPGEYFVEFGLRIKEEAAPTHTLVVTCANGHVGYIPTVMAFSHGGYETTFGPGSMLAPEAGDLIASCAIRMIHDMRSDL